MGDFIGVDIRGLDQLQSALKELPEEAEGAAVEAVAIYLQNVMKLYPPQNSVTRAQAYPDTPAFSLGSEPARRHPGWFSAAQMKWFFANLGNLDIPYKRTQTLAQSWEILGSGKNALLVNEAPHAIWTMDDDMQSRHEGLVGWKKIGTILQERSSRIGEVASGAINRALDKLFR